MSVSSAIHELRSESENYLLSTYQYSTTRKMKFGKKLASNSKPMERNYQAFLQERTAALYPSVSSIAAMFSEIRHTVTDEIEAELDKRLESTR